MQNIKTYDVLVIGGGISACVFVSNYLKNNLKVIFSALDVKSYEELKEEGFKYFKIPSTISHHKKFIQYLAKQKSALTYISTGMTDQKYLNFILKLFRKKKIVLNLPKITFLRVLI